MPILYTLKVLGSWGVWYDVYKYAPIYVPQPSIEKDTVVFQPGMLNIRLSSIPIATEMETYRWFPTLVGKTQFLRAVLTTKKNAGQNTPRSIGNASSTDPLSSHAKLRRFHHTDFAFFKPVNSKVASKFQVSRDPFSSFSFWSKSNLQIWGSVKSKLGWFCVG